MDELRERTLAYRVKGLGFSVPKAMRYGADMNWDESVDETGIDHGSEYAKSLGFRDDVAWPVDETTTPNSKKKKKKKKKKSSSTSEGPPAAPVS